MIPYRALSSADVPPANAYTMHSAQPAKEWTVTPHRDLSAAADAALRMQAANVRAFAVTGIPYELFHGDRITLNVNHSVKTQSKPNQNPIKRYASSDVKLGRPT